MAAKDRLKDAIKWGVPDSILFRVSPHVVRWYAKTMTWYTCGRHYEAPIDPTDIIYINPSDVNRLVTNETLTHFQHSNVISEVVDGKWDTLTKPLSEYHVYTSFRAHFLHDVEWEHTDLFQVRKRRFAEGDYVWGCESMEDFRTRLDVLDKMFQNMKKEGYKNQLTLRKRLNDETALRDIHRYWPPELHEVTLNIARDGKLILHDGRHRMSFAKILGIDSIPVRIKTRHHDWQRKRDAVRREGNDSCNSNHPDLYFDT